MISVVILAYDTFDKLERLLDSLPVSSEYVEYIVVDNGSHTVWPGREGFKTVRIDPNQGVPGGFNAGLEVATGDWLVCIACDTICTSPDFPQNTQLPGKVMTGPYIRGNPGNLPITYLDGWCYAFPRNLIDDIGYLDPYYFYCWEDVDFCLRAQRAGYTLHQIDCGIINVTPPRYQDIPYYYDRNMRYLREKLGV